MDLACIPAYGTSLYQSSSTTRCGNMPIYWQHGSSELRAPNRCRLPGPLITYMKQEWTKMLWTQCSIRFLCTKPSSLASLSLVASCDMFFKMESSSPRPLLEGKYSGLVMRFSSCIGPTVINQNWYTCMRVGRWSIILLSWENIVRHGWGTGVSQPVSISDHQLRKVAEN